MNRSLLPVAIGLLSFFASSSAWSEPSTGHPTSPTPTAAGDSRFDVADRLAITNLFGAMIRGLDEQELDLLVSTVTPDFWAEYRIPGSPVLKVTGRDAFRAMMAQRFEILKKSGIQRRHIITPPYFLEQTPETARVSIHFLNCTSTQKKNWHPFVSAQAHFQVIKREGVWQFSSQIENTDIPLDLPITELLPGLKPTEK